MKKILTAVAALGLVVSPAVAQAKQAERDASPVKGEEKLGGQSFILLALLAAAVMAGIIIIADNNNNDSPTSP